MTNAIISIHHVIYSYIEYLVAYNKIKFCLVGRLKFIAHQ